MSGMEDTQNQAWAKNKSSFGYKMLLKQGWTEGKGLGKDAQGAVKHVKVTKRPTDVGLGASNDVTGNTSLTAAVSDYNSLLAALAQTHTDPTKAKTKKASKKRKERKEVASLSEASRLTHKRRAAAKDTSKYSAADMAAILGVAASPPPPSADESPTPAAGSPPPPAADSPPSGEPADSAAEKAARRAAKKERRAARAAKKARKAAK